MMSPSENAMAENGQDVVSEYPEIVRLSLC